MYHVYGTPYFEVLNNDLLRCPNVVRANECMISISITLKWVSQWYFHVNVNKCQIYLIKIFVFTWHFVSKLFYSAWRASQAKS